MPIRQTQIKVKYSSTMYGGTVQSGGHTHLQPLGVVNDTSSYEVTSTLTARYENITSVSSGNTRKVMVTRWTKNPKRRSPPKRPVEPRFNPPRLPIYSPKVNVRSSQRVQSKQLQRYNAKYSARLSQATERRARYIDKYRVRKANYLTRLARYNALMSLVSGPKMKRVSKAADRIWNPYSRQRISSTGLKYNIDTEYRARVTAVCSHGLPTLFSATNPNTICWKQQERGTRVYTPTPVPTSVYTALNQAVESQAIAKLHGKLKDAQSHIGNLLAERQQTLDMLGSAVHGLATAIRAKRGFFQSLMSNFSSPKDVADATLAFQFGLRPLMNDIYQAAEGIAKMVVGNARTKVHVQAQQHDTVVKVTKNPGSVMTETCVIEIKVAYTFEYNIDNSVLNGLSQWGLINPAELAWEALPWSFAIDWVLPIGSWISSLTSDAGLVFSRGCKVTTVTKRYSTAIIYDGSWQGQYRTQGQVVGAYVEESKTRTLIDSPPTFVPLFKNPFSINHAIDALALLVQRR